MKKYIRQSNDFKNKATQFISKAYTEEGIAKRAATGSHKGESMEQVFNNIMNDPNITIENPDQPGNHTIFYKGKNIGWVNFERGMGWIDDKEYQKLEKYVAPEVPEDYGDDYTDDDLYGF